MRNLSLGIAVVAVMMLSMTVIAQQQQEGQQQPAAAAGAAAAATDLDKIWCEGAAITGMFEQKLSEAAQQQASDPQVKQFAQTMAQDHQQVNQQCQQLCQRIGVSVPQQLPDHLQRKLDAIKAQQGKDFDQAYLSSMKAMHLSDVSSFADKAQIAKNQDVKQFAAQQLPKLQQHQQHVISLASAQGLPTPAIGEAQPAGGRIPAEGQQPRPGEGPDAGQRGTQGQPQETGRESGQQSR